MNYRNFFLALFILLTLVGPTYAAEKIPPPAGEIKNGVRAEGACAIVGMSAEQSILTALQRARAAAIEQAAGVAVTSGTLVTNFTLAADFIKTYARGFIVSEKAEWLPLGQYQKDAATPPIPEYRVRIAADVYVPKQRAPVFGLQGRLNSAVFRNGEQARIAVTAVQAAKLAIFNIRADDRVALIFPNGHERNNSLAAGREFVFPGKDAKVELEMQTLPDHQKDAEAFLIIAWDSGLEINIGAVFPERSPLGLNEFFQRLATIADRIERRSSPTKSSPDIKKFI